MNQAKLQQVFKKILKERERQDSLQVAGRFKHTCADEVGLTPSQKYVVLGEETGEVARVLLNLNELATDFSVEIEGMRSPEVWLKKKLQKELTEVAAVTCAWLESMELDPTEGIQL